MTTGQNGRLDVLLVEDNEGDARLIRHHLRSDTSTVFEPPDLTHVESLAAAVERLAAEPFDLVLLDLGLADSHGIETLERLNERIDAAEDIPPHPVVVLTGLTDDETALRAIQEGAQDYLLKDKLDGALLERAIRYAMERHRQEQRLKRQNERLERFASIVSHDLRNPLNVAQGRLSHEAGLREGTDTSMEHIDEAIDALDRMEGLVDDLLELARDGQSIDEVETVRVGDLIQSAWGNVPTPASELHVDVSEAVTADPRRLTQLFENLFRNAIEHGGSDVTITVGRVDDGLYVADDGSGIPEEKREEAFEVGYSTNEDGTGVGLDIVREVADGHGWEITVVESADGGARFEITGMGLPAA